MSFTTIQPDQLGVSLLLSGSDMLELSSKFFNEFLGPMDLDFSVTVDQRCDVLLDCDDYVLWPTFTLKYKNNLLVRFKFFGSFVFVLSFDACFSVIDEEFKLFKKKMPIFLGSSLELEHLVMAGVHLWGGSYAPLADNSYSYFLQRGLTNESCLCEFRDNELVSLSIKSGNLVDIYGSDTLSSIVMKLKFEDVPFVLSGECPELCDIFLQAQGGNGKSVLNKPINGRRLDHDNLSRFVKSLCRKDQLRVAAIIKKNESDKLQKDREAKDTKLQAQAGSVPIGNREFSFADLSALFSQLDVANSRPTSFVEVQPDQAPQGLFSRLKSLFTTGFSINHTIDRDSRDYLAKVMEEIKNLKNLKVNVEFDIPWKKIFVSLVLAGLCYMALSNKDKSLMTKLKDMALPMLVLAGVALTPVVSEYLNSFFDDGVRAQAVTAGSFSKIAGLLYILVGSFVNGVPKDVRGFENYFVKLAMFDKFKSGTMEVMSTVVFFVESLVNYLRDRVFGWDGVKFIENTIPELRSWCEALDIVIEDVRAGRFELNSENAKTVYALDKESRRLESAKYSSNADKLEVRMAMNSYRSCLKQIVSKFETANLTGNGTRMEPLAVLVLGESGVGKTTAVEPFVRKLLLRVLPEEKIPRLASHFYDFVYNRQAEHKYWDAYRGQIVATIDEFGQCRDVAGNPDNEFMEIIRMVNRFPMICHMADIGSKGTTPFLSKIIFATTNIKNIKPASIVQPEAVARRFDIVAQCVPKREYSIDRAKAINERRLDMTLPVFQSNEHVSDIHEYHMMRARRNGDFEPTGVVLSEAEFLELSIAAFRKKEDAHNKYVKYLDSIVRPQSGSDVIMEDLESSAASTASSDIIVANWVFDLEDLMFAIAPIIGVDHARANCVHERYEEFLHEYMDLYTTNMSFARNFIDEFKEMHESASFAVDRHIMFVACLIWSHSGMTNPIYSMRSRIVNNELIVSDSDFSELRSAHVNDFFSTKVRRLVAIKRATYRAWERARAVLKPLYVKLTWNIYCNVKNLIVKHAQLWEMIKNSAFVVGYASLLGAISYKITLMLIPTINRVSGHNKKAMSKGFWAATSDGRGGYTYKYIPPSDFANHEVTRQFVSESGPEPIVERYVINKLDPITAPIVGHNDVGKPLFETAWERAGVQKVLDGMMNAESGVRDEVRLIAKQLRDEGFEIAINDDHTPNADSFQQFVEEINRRYEARKHGESGGLRSGVHRKVQRFVRNSKQPSITLRAEACLDKCARDIALKVANRSLYEFIIDYGDEKSRLGFGTFLRGRVFMFPLHFIGSLKAKIDDDFSDLSRSSRVLLKGCMGRVVLDLPVSLFVDSDPMYHYKEQDTAFVHIKQAHQHPDITMLFMTTDQLTLKTDNVIMLVSWDKAEDGVISHTVNAKKVFSQKVTNEDYSYEVDEGVDYMSQISAGDCGTLAIVSNRHIAPGKIIGMHVAGSSNGYGFSVFTPQEMVDVVVSDLGRLDLPPPIPDEVVAQSGDLPFSGAFVPYYKLPKPINQAVKTVKMKSRIHNKVMPNKVAPAKLRDFVNKDGELISPRGLATAKYGRPNKAVVPTRTRLLALASVKTHFKKVQLQHTLTKPFVLTFEEACQGLNDDHFMRAIPRRTSAGYPYVASPVYGYRGKEYYFGKAEKFDFEREGAKQLRREVEEVIEKAKRCQRSPFLYVDSLKDECRPFDKVNAGKTRLISCSPLVLAIVTKMYFAHFCASLMKNALELGVGIGLNPFSDDWDALYKRLTRFSDEGVAGDFAGYDTCHTEADYQDCLDIINHYYQGTAEEELIRFVLMSDVSCSLHISGDIVYQWIAGMPSGSFLTTPLNCVLGHLKFNQVWYALRPGDEKFYDHVYHTQTGDDNVAGISKVVSSWYNQRTITMKMADFGYTYTDEQKGENQHTVRPIKDLTYLCRSFRFEPYVSRYVAPLSLASISEMLNWTTRGAMSLEITQNNCETAMSEISLHGKECFYEWAPRLEREALESLKYVLQNTHWQTVLERTCRLQNQY